MGDGPVVLLGTRISQKNQYIYMLLNFINPCFQFRREPILSCWTHEKVVAWHTTVAKQHARKRLSQAESRPEMVSTTQISALRPTLHAFNKKISFFA